MIATRIIAALAVTLAATTAAAQNLISNPTFDVSAALWSGGGVYSPIDALGSTTSGSLSLTNNSPSFNAVASSSCVAVTPGAKYDGRADVMIPAGGAWAILYFLSYPSTDCTGSAYSAPVVTSPGDGKWHTMAPSSYTMPATAHSAVLGLVLSKPPALPTVTANFDNAVFKAHGTCAPLPNIMCLNENRFEVQATWNTATQTGAAFATKLTNDSGYLWFFSSTNIEVVLKILNGCGVNGMYWFYSGGLTDQGVDIKVTDAKTGTSRTYSNSRGSAFQPIQDASAFSTCP